MTAEPALDALIFDLDGTLVDTLDDITDALNRALRVHGLPEHPRTAVRAMVGEGTRNLTRAALPASAAALAHDVFARFREDYSANYLVRSAPYPGVTELLAALARRGVAMCVLSNKPHEPTRAIIAALFAEVPFVEVAGQRSDRPMKPDPTVALELARAMGVASERCGFVGDSGVDMRTARAAGMHGLGVTWGFRDEAELIEHGAAGLISAPEQLLHVLQAGPASPIGDFEGSSKGAPPKPRWPASQPAGFDATARSISGIAAARSRRSP